MKFNAHVSVARSEEEARSRLETIGADEGGREVMAPKMRHYTIKLEEVPTSAAVWLKEEMLKLGAEAAISRDAYYGEAEQTDVLLMGTVDQYLRLSQKLRNEKEDLAKLARDLPLLFTRMETTHFEVPTPAGKLILGDRPLLMGIVNCTPDSFYDGGKYFDPAAAVRRGKELAEAGAAILDVGGESTRPGAEPVAAEEEIRRVIPVIERLAKETRAIISVDTQKAEVARKAVAAGAAIINDVSALADPAMARVAAESGAVLVLMHMQGTPQTMQKDPRYHDLFGEIISYLRERMARALAAGVDEERIIVDPGIGFGKTVAHNLELIRDLWRLRSLGRPILLGPSNKTFIGKVLGVEPQDRKEGTAAACVAGVLAGAHLLRVHEVAGMKPFVDMAEAIKSGERWGLK